MGVSTWLRRRSLEQVLMMKIIRKDINDWSGGEHKIRAGSVRAFWINVRISISGHEHQAVVFCLFVCFYLNPVTDLSWVDYIISLFKKRSILMPLFLKQEELLWYVNSTPYTLLITLEV